MSSKSPNHQALQGVVQNVDRPLSFAERVVPKSPDPCGQLTAVTGPLTEGRMRCHTFCPDSILTVGPYERHCCRRRSDSLDGTDGLDH